MAKVILIIPFTIVVSKSSLSARDSVLDDYKSSLNPRTVDALMCLANWFRAQYKDSLNLQVNALAEEELIVQRPDQTLWWTSQTRFMGVILR